MDDQTISFSTGVEVEVKFVPREKYAFVCWSNPDGNAWTFAMDADELDTLIEIVKDRTEPIAIFGDVFLPFDPNENEHLVQFLTEIKAELVSV